jgi:hypothetical protein
MARRNAFANRDYATIASSAALWLYVTARIGLQLFGDTRDWVGAVAAFLFFTWVCRACVTYRRVSLYLLPSLYVSGLVAGAVELSLDRDRSALPGFLLGALIVGGLCAVVLCRRRLYL